MLPRIGSQYHHDIHIVILNKQVPSLENINVVLLVWRQVFASLILSSIAKWSLPLQWEGDARGMMNMEIAGIFKFPILFLLHRTDSLNWRRTQWLQWLAFLKYDLAVFPFFNVWRKRIDSSHKHTESNNRNNQHKFELDMSKHILNDPWKSGQCCLEFPKGSFPTKKPHSWAN